MKETNYDQLYMRAYLIIDETDARCKEYFSVKTLAAWFCGVYITFDQEKVITTRLQTQYDVSVVISHHKLSVINNETGRHSWVKVDEVIEYEELEADVYSMLECLSFALLRSEV